MNKRGQIVQFSPPRSGSNILHNMLRDIFPGQKITKDHSYRPHYDNASVVTTYRHPLDCMASQMQCFEREVTDKNIETTINEYKQLGMWHVPAIRDKPNVLMLKYEEFRYDYEYIYKHLEEFFNIKLSDGQRESLSLKYHIDAIKKTLPPGHFIDSYLKDGSFWHANHISKYNGKCYYYKEFFTKEQIKYLKEVYKDYINIMGYDKISS